MTREELYDSIVQRCNENDYKLIGSNRQIIERFGADGHAFSIIKKEKGYLARIRQSVPNGGLKVEALDILTDILKYMNWDETDAN